MYATLWHLLYSRNLWFPVCTLSLRQRWMLQMGSLSFYWKTWCRKFMYWKYIWKICPWAYLVVLQFCFSKSIFFITFIESEWQLLLSFILETVSICPQAFVSSVHHSSAVPNRDHGELNVMLCACFPFAFATRCWIEIDSYCHGVSHTVVLQKSFHGCLLWLSALE